jgi:hypothetical protein
MKNEILFAIVGTVGFYKKSLFNAQRGEKER